MKILNTIFHIPYSIYRWCTATRLRKVLSSTLAVLIVLTSIRFIFLKPGEVKAADVLLGFNEGYGTTSAVHDTNSTVSAGSITNAVWKTEDLCKVGKCLYFDGTGDYVSFGDDANLDMAATDTVTVELWFRTPDITSGTRTLISKEEATGADGGYRIEMNSSGQIRFGIDSNNDTFPLYSVTSASAYDNNSWHHIAAVKNGTATMTLYIDALSVGTTSIASTAADNDDIFYIGIYNGSSDGFTGFIDEVKVLRTARTADEVKADHLGETPQRGTSASFGPDQSWLSDGLVGYWKMDETDWTNDCSTDSALDSSGNGFHGDSCPSTTGPDPAAGKFGNGGNFDGTDDYINAGNITTIDSVSQMTMTAWFKFDSRSRWDNIISKYNNSNNRTEMGLGVLGDEDDIQVTVSNGSTSYGSTTGNIIANNTWYFGTMVFDGTQSTNEKRLSFFLNGVQQALTFSGTVPTTTHNQTSNVTIGSENGNSETFTDGLIDEVRIYNRALSPTEVSQLYNWAPGPVAHWKMDEGTGTTTNDASGSNNNATLYNNPVWSPGKFGSSLLFDGASGLAQNDYLIAGSDTSIDDIFTGGGTIETWIYPKSDGETYGTIFDKSVNGTSGGYWLYVDTPTGNALALNFLHAFNLPNTQNSWYSTGYVINMNQWNHVAVVYDNSSSLNDPLFYVNGLLVGVTNSARAGGTFQSDASNNLIIGNLSNGARTFDGNIDNVQFYNYSRTQGQIIEDMNAGHPAPGSPIGSALGHWKFDEGIGDTLNNSGSLGSTLNGDIGGSGQTCPAASETVCPAWSNDGKFGRTMFFDNADDYIQIPDDNSLSFGNGTTDSPFTISAWINTATNEAAGDIISKYNTSIPDTEYRFLINNNNISALLYDDSTGSNIGRIGQTTLADNAWYHVVMTYSGSASASGIKLYVNGSRDDTSDSNAGTYTAMENTTSTVYIGLNSASLVNDFNGYIDEVQIFGSELTADQVKVLYNFGSAQTLGDVDDHNNEGFGGANPVGWWKIDEGTGTSTTADYSGSFNDLTMNNFESGDWAQYSRYDHKSYALTLDGSTESLSRADDDDFDFGSGEFSISAWVRHNGAIDTSPDFIITKAQDGTAGGYKLYMDASGDFCFDLDDDTAWNPDISACTSGIDYDDNAWHHVTGVKTETAVADLYVDGKAVASQNGSQISHSNANALYIGMDRDGTTGGWDGQIDEVKIFNYALTGGQVAYNYNRSTPFAWYKLDECTGSTINNSASTTAGDDAGYDGTITIGAGGSETTVGDCSTSSTAWGNGATGKFNGSLDLDGTDDYINIPENDIFDIFQGGSFTIEAWVNRGSFGSIDIVTAKANNITTPTEAGWSMYIHPNDTILFQLGSGSTSKIAQTASPNIINSSGWNHIVGVFDDGSLNIYLNGKFAATGTGTLGGNTNNALDVRIGSESDGGEPFDGSIDNVKYYHSAFSAEQIKRLYNEGRAQRFGPATGSP